MAFYLVDFPPRPKGQAGERDSVFTIVGKKEYTWFLHSFTVNVPSQSCFLSFALSPGLHFIFTQSLRMQTSLLTNKEPYIMEPEKNVSVKLSMMLITLLTVISNCKQFVTAALHVAVVQKPPRAAEAAACCAVQH